MRAKRRAAIERMRARVRQWISWWRYVTWTEEEKAKYVARNADTRHPCSRWCCGNPRKYFGEKTLQEKKAELPEEE